MLTGRDIFFNLFISISYKMNCDAYFLYIAVFKKDLCVEVGFI